MIFALLIVQSCTKEDTTLPLGKEAAVAKTDQVTPLDLEIEDIEAQINKNHAIANGNYTNSLMKTAKMTLNLGNQNRSKDKKVAFFHNL
jgi:hypothetical protein